MAEETRLSRTGTLPAADNRSTRTEDVARIRADIETTRAAMSDTLDQIQDRLNPTRLKQQAKDTVREATIGRVKKMARNAGDRAGDAGRGIIDVVRDNPLPLALIGIGAGWLLMSSRRRSQVDYQQDVLLTERTPVGYETGSTYDTTEAARGTGSTYDTTEATRGEGLTHRVSERAADVGDTVRAAAGSAAHRIGDVATGLGSRVTDVASSVRGRVSNAASSIAGGTQRIATRANYQYQETPWVGAAVALGLGMAAGLAIPETDRERELIGDRREQLLNRVRSAGREKLDSIRTVAQEVIQDTKEAVRESVREHAREEGLTDTGATGGAEGAEYKTGSPV